MSRVHGTNTVIKLSGANMPVTGTADISPYVKSSEFERSADVHDNTTYGKQDKVYDGGLRESTFKMNGVYDSSTTSGPRFLLKPVVGKSVTLTRQPEGTGTGKPQESVTIVIKKYTETNPVDGYIAWSCDAQCSDAITDTTQ